MFLVIRFAIRKRLYVQTRSGMALYFTLQLLATDNGWLRITSARHEEATAWGRHSPVHRAVTAARECRCQVSDSVRSDLTPTLREDRSGKRVLETPCHTRIATSPQDITDHVSGSAEPNVTWDTNFPR